MQPTTVLITVPTPGTPVQLPHVPGGCAAMLVKGLASNTGASVYLGNSATFDKTGGTGLIIDLLKSTNQYFMLEMQNARDQIFPDQYWVDVATSGDKVAVTYWVE